MNLKKIFNVASFKRETTLLKTIDSIYNHADQINIALNLYEEIPYQLYDDKINLIITDNSKGDAFKFNFLEESDGYFFTIDDDLIYRNDYTDYMIERVENTQRKSVITLHGRSFDKFPILSYYKSATKRLRCLDEQLNDDFVQFGGTGVMCFHTDLFKLSMDYFLSPNMADIWIGKYCYENNLKIVCVKHPSGMVTQQKIYESIYDLESKNDQIQTKVVNNLYLPKEVSIIIPSYNEPKFLYECLESVIKSVNNLSCEILVGIDGCKKTLEFVKKNVFDARIRFFYFEKNVGPYIIKNTLFEISKSENILFFDSDDLMGEDMIKKIIQSNRHNTIVKPMYEEFSNDKNLNWTQGVSGKYGEGVFLTKREIFKRMNGFEGWKCAADSEFMNRIYKNGIPISVTDKPVFKRRLHSNSLTQNPQTNYSSELRAKYFGLSKHKKDFGPLQNFITENYREITIPDIQKIELSKLEIQKNLASSVLGEIFKNNRPKFNVDYKGISEKIIKQGVYDVNSSKKPIRENKPTNRQDLIEIKNNSNASQVQKLNPSKPNRRKEIPNIFRNKKSF